MARPVTVAARIDGRPVSRDEVLAWEARRYAPAARKVGLDVPSGSLPERRVAFADAKLELGAARLRGRLSRDLRLSGLVARAGTRASRDRRVLSVCDLDVAGGDAETFVAWFTDTARADYQRSMLAANPDHFLIDVRPDGRQEVIETTGGSPLATHFLVDYTDTAPLSSDRDPGYPHELAGAARTEAGAVIGGVRHELRATRDGFHALLQVEFPRLTAPSMIRTHRWHLACEFSNWVESAFGDGTP